MFIQEILGDSMFHENHGHTASAHTAADPRSELPSPRFRLQSCVILSPWAWVPWASDAPGLTSVPSEQAELCFDPCHAPSIRLWFAVFALLGEENLSLGSRPQRKAGTEATLPAGPWTC